MRGGFPAALQRTRSAALGRPLRVLLITWGSEGDVRPFLGLARALQARGHEPVLAAGAYLRDRVLGSGLRFRTLGPYAAADLTRVMSALGRERRLIRHPALIAEHLDAFLDDFLPRAMSACHEADVVVTHSLCLFGLLAAESAGRPCAVVHPFPTFLPGDGFLWNGRSVGPLNRAFWACARPFLRRGTDFAYTRLFERLQLGRPRDVLLRASHSRWLNLLPFSPELVHADPRWGPHYKVTGFWSTDQEGALPDDLERFLNAGPPPAVITFGSMTSPDPARLTALLLTAVQRAGVRAVLQAGAAGLGASVLPADVHLLQGDVPHLAIFRRAACVVHHGGAGTTGTAARAGIPQVVVPALGDQSFWARRLVRAGVCAHWRPMARLSASWLARALVMATGSVRVRRNARDLAARVAQEDGPEHAVDAIEAAFAHAVPVAAEAA